jgi:hypothetical protein
MVFVVLFCAFHFIFDFQTKFHFIPIVERAYDSQIYVNESIFAYQVALSNCENTE